LAFFFSFSLLWISSLQGDKGVATRNVLSASTKSVKVLKLFATANVVVDNNISTTTLEVASDNLSQQINCNELLAMTKEPKLILAVLVINVQTKFTK
jgi:hypothetical protein